MKKIFLLLILFAFQLTWAQDKMIQKKSKSFLKIPFTHFDYNELSGKLDDSVHTGIKALHFFEIDNNIITNRYNNLNLHKKSWFGRKLFDEHFFSILGDDYSITIDPVVDLRLGKDNLTTDKTIYQNTRALRVSGSIGKQFSFSATIAENMARFPLFLDRYAWANRPAIIPGHGLNKSENKAFVDYPYADGYFAYKPGKYFMFEVGHGKHFIGEGYRSLFLSDNASVYPYFKVDATFWHVKYTTMWTAYQDMRPEVTVDGVFKKKFSAIHYIDWNATPKLNIGFFESVVWYNTNRRGFDVNFLNPLIFFKTAEYEAGSNGSNTVVGLSAHYKTPYHFKIYGQFLLDEMQVNNFFKKPDHWANKFGYQIGVKYPDAFKVPNLFLRLEYNSVRPFTYGHNTQIANYGHNYQSLAHPWGANFKETVFEVQYRKNRIYVHNTLSVGQKGFDFPNDTIAYGGDIYHYHERTDGVTEYKILNGNLGKILINQFEAGYIVNPATNLKLFGGMIYRDTKIDQEIKTVKNETSKYIYFGIKTHLWNDHFDVF
jgi:hypothetical protein